MARPLRIGTRGSPLALAQARMVAEALRQAQGWSAERIEIVPMITSGDVIQDRPLAEIGGKALWTKELDRALLEGKTDVSVHSMKDVETLRPAELVIGAVLPRADGGDRPIGAPGLSALPFGARVGSSSPRRRAQLLHHRPDLEMIDLRGNVQTRLAKVQKGEIDATLLAAAGLARLGIDAGVPMPDLLPAPAQGAIGVEARAGDAPTLALLQPIDEYRSHQCIDAERRLLEGLGGSCHSPVAARADMDEVGQISLRAEIHSSDGRERVDDGICFQAGDHDAPFQLARRLLEAASPDLRRLFGL